MTPEQAIRIWTKRGFVEDRYSEAKGAVIMAPGEATARLSTGRPNILVLEPGDEAGAAANRLHEFDAVFIHFPAFTDGRGFSTARLLREKHRYTGHIRATGHFLLDQIPLMLRTGFDEFAVADPAVIARLAENRIPAGTRHYQPALDTEAATASRSWRRLDANNDQPLAGI